MNNYTNVYLETQCMSCGNVVRVASADIVKSVAELQHEVEILRNKVQRYEKAFEIIARYHGGDGTVSREQVILALSSCVSNKESK